MDDCVFERESRSHGWGSSSEKREEEEERATISPLPESSGDDPKSKRNVSNSHFLPSCMSGDAVNCRPSYFPTFFLKRWIEIAEVSNG